MRVEQLIREKLKRVNMYVGRSDFGSVNFWVSGFDYANSLAFPEETSDLDGFREWLLVRIGGSCNITWAGIIGEHYGDGDEATQRFFELFGEFRAAVDARGLKAIMKDHYDYEVESYGAPRSSEYFSNGWNKR